MFQGKCAKRDAMDMQRRQKDRFFLQESGTEQEIKSEPAAASRSMRRHTRNKQSQTRKIRNQAHKDRTTTSAPRDWFSRVQSLLLSLPTRWWKQKYKLTFGEVAASTTPCYLNHSEQRPLL
ncbi:hypothetical protein BDV10DRAFT_6616 [Aspergillus recurvatus]